VLHLRLFDPIANLAALMEASRFVRRYRLLIAEMTRREITDRYAGQVLGAAWAIGVPLLTMGVYVFAFTVLFRGRIGPTDNGLGYTAYVLAAIVPWLALQDVLNRATVCVSGSASLVKQIVFPTEVLPLKVVLATVPALIVGLIVTTIMTIASGATNAFGTLVLLPIAVLLLLFMCAGLAYILAAVGVFLRDIKDIMGVLLMIGFFIHPIIYPPDRVPGWLGRLFAISPFTHVIGTFRDALVQGAVTRPWSWLISLVTALVLTVIGWRVFRMLRPSFGNAL
jgi:homopolymeric O-antigen transport system permease protein